MKGPSAVVLEEKTIMQPLFTNSEVDFDSIPRISEVHWHKVSKRLVTRNTIRNVFTWAIFFLLALGLMILGWIPFKVVFVHPVGTTLSLVGIAVAAVCILWPVFEVPHRGYVLRDHDFLYRQGLLFVRTYSIPFARVQHAETTVSVFDRIVNLGALRLFTAGAQNVFLGFEKEYAHDLRIHILDRVRDLDSEMRDEAEPGIGSPS